MASTNKTTNLHLNSWIESDKPKRTDFVMDNSIIDSVLGTHINDSDLHLTLAEKTRVHSPYSISLEYGTGTSTLTYNPGFAPSMAIIFKTNTPLITTVSGYPQANYAIATAKGSTGGATLSGSTFTVRQSTGSENGVIYNLNENNEPYVIIYFR
jgi:hypothetical protein